MSRIPELIDQQGIPGLAVALVDADQALWVEGFGHLDGRDSARVTVYTIFSVESVSKLFTATAVMQAVAAGRLDLDEPITTYLPDFTVHSAFEEHRARKITLRMLLGHTAGFTQEAPIGNNTEPNPDSFDAHVRGISDTWLRFPVGSGYAYSIWASTSPATSWNASRASPSPRSCATRCSARSAWTAAPSTGRRSDLPTIGRWGTRIPILSRRSRCR